MKLKVEVKYLMVNGRVRFRSLEVSSMAYINSFQENIKVRIAALAMADLLMGSITCQKVRPKPAPSMQAASSSSCGMDRKKFFSKIGRAHV